MLKSHYGKYGQQCLALGRGLEWKLCCTGTPAPNDRIEYANHAVFLDAFPTINSFLARFFVNRGQTGERWVLKHHALGPFYRALSHWAIFLQNPATYGWKDLDTDTIPPIHTHIHHVELTEDQRKLLERQTGRLFVMDVGGIGSRSRLAAIGKGWNGKQAIETNKYAYMRSLVDSWPGESVIIWCLYNNEQDRVDKTFPEAVSIRGSTPHAKRMEWINEFKAGQRRVLITKPKILGFGLNLQVCTRQIFSGLQDSYESFYQAVKRSNRIGSKSTLHVHIPVTDAEEPMVQNVLRKAHRVQQDTEEQERIFHDAAREFTSLASARG
jgi:superfamily II DNA or RNA helicase